MTKLLIFDTPEGRITSHSPDNYRLALEVIRQNPYLAPSLNRGDFGFKSTIDIVEARAVLLHVSEEAQRLADPDFVDNARTKVIDDKYGDITTSKVITAYVDILETRVIFQ